MDLHLGRVLGDRGVGRQQHLAFELRLVDVRGVSHLPGQQFDLQPGKAQGQEIGRHGVAHSSGAAFEFLQSPSDQLAASGRLALTDRPIAFTAVGKAAGKLVAADLRHDHQPARNVQWRAIDAGPARHLAGRSEQSQVHDQPAARKEFGIVPFAVKREILQAVTWEQNQQFFEFHVAASEAARGQPLFYDRLVLGALGATIAAGAGQVDTHAAWASRKIVRSLGR